MPDFGIGESIAIGTMAASAGEAAGMASLAGTMGAVGATTGGLATAATSGLSFASIASYASLGSTLLGGVMRAVGGAQSADASKNMALYQAQVAHNNALIAKQNARLTEEEGNVAEEKENMKTRAIVGAMEAQQGASGIDVSTGSARDSRISAEMLGKQDVLNIRSNTARRELGYDTTARGFEDEASLDRYTATNASKAGGINLVGTLLDTASSVGSKYSTWKMYKGSDEALFA